MKPWKIPADRYEKLFRALMHTSADGIFIVDHEFKIYSANQKAAVLYKKPFEKLIGMDFRQLSPHQERDTLEQICSGMGENARWKGKANGLSGDGEIFPVELSVTRFEDKRFHCCVVVRDMSEQIVLQESLEQEKAHRREMYITLRNVMSSVEKEKIGLERLVAHKIETLLLPALDKAKRESAKDIQSGYLDFIRAQLLGLTKTFPRELDIGFVRLTRSEMKICQYLQAGYSSKEIAEALNIAFETIQTHRKNIRRKLGLHGKKISLYSFLSTRRKLGDIAKP
jgi:PAS domain S-box-containing protein